MTPQDIAADASQDGVKVPMPERFPALHWYPQQDEWIRAPWDSDNVCSNYPFALQLQGPLDYEALRQGLEEIVRRHQVFRSVFGIEGTQMVHKVLPPSAFSITEINLEAAKEDERRRQATQLAVEDAQTPFDLTREPLFRTTLFRLEVEEHILLLTTHHFVCDDWSMDILLTELAQLYSAFSRKEPPSLPDVQYEYSDFVRDHAREMQGEERSSRLRFWKQQIAGGNFHHLATDYPRPNTKVFNGKRKEVVFPALLDEALKALSQSNSSSPFIVLVAGFMCLLGRYSGSEDVGVGICVANRNSVEAEQLIGPFSNRLVLRTEIPAEFTAQEMLERVQDAAWEAFSCQEIPFGEVMENSVPAGSPTRNSLLQTMIVYENSPKHPWEFHGLKVRRFPFDSGMACYDLHIWLRNQGGLEMAIQYNADVLAPETIQQIVDDYQAILEAMVENPEDRVKNLLTVMPMHSEEAVPDEVHAF